MKIIFNYNKNNKMTLNQQEHQRLTRAQLRKHVPGSLPLRWSRKLFARGLKEWRLGIFKDLLHLSGKFSAKNKTIEKISFHCKTLISRQRQRIGLPLKIRVKTALRLANAKARRKKEALLRKNVDVFKFGNGNNNNSSLPAPLNHARRAALVYLKLCPC